MQVLIDLPPQQAKALRRITGARTTADAVREYLSRLAPHYSPKQLKRALGDSDREDKAGKGRTFKTARAAMEWLES